MKTPDKELKLCLWANPKYMKKYYEEFYEYIMKEYEGNTFAEKLYRHLHKGEEMRDTCINCGKKLRFKGLTRGWGNYCSYTCMNGCEETKEKRRRTLMKNYGVDNPNRSSIIQEKIKKTNIEKYGVDNPFKSEEIKSKIKETLKEKYGEEQLSKIKEIQDKREKTLIERYGVKYSTLLPQFREGRKKQITSYILEMHKEIKEVDIEKGEYLCYCPHVGCNLCKEKCYSIPSSVFYDRKRDHIEPCTHILPFSVDRNTNTTLELFVRCILDKENINYETNVRTIISPMELDIWIPDKRIAIECNGVYWHSLRTPQYHKRKWKRCEEEGIQLITIWEDWIKEKPEIVEYMIRRKMGVCGEEERKVDGRKCIIEEIGSKEGGRFLEENHIQGKCRGEKWEGLKTGDGEIVGVMVWGRRRGCMGKNKNKEEGEWELRRYCTKRGVRVRGGMGKMMKYFIEEMNPSKIVSFSMNDISKGEVYEILGFKKERVNNSYWYIDLKTLKRYHRSTFTKKEIVRRGWEIEGGEWTEKEAMRKRGIVPIFDSGITKWVIYI